MHWCSLPSQVVELDFQYPSEGIHKRWDGGYRITALAATPDQVCGSLGVVCLAFHAQVDGCSSRIDGAHCQCMHMAHGSAPA